MKARRVWVFTGPGEEWRGDCPLWVDAMRRSRPDLTVTVERWLGSRWRCSACEQGHRH